METVSKTLQPMWELASPTSCALACLCVFLAAFYRYNTRYRGLWEKYGIPVPPAWPVINHWPAFRAGEDAPLKEWFKEYGDTFGTYGMFPHDPVLVTRDVKLLKHILIKDFGNFRNRYFSRLTWTSILNSLFLSRDTAWRRTRHLISPMFTCGKLRLMLTHVNNSANTLRDLMKFYSKNKELVPVKIVSGKFASEVLARVGLGIESHDVSTETTAFAFYAEKYFRMSTPVQNFIQALDPYFPPLFYIVRRLGLKVDIFDEDADEYFKRVVKQEINRRTKERLRLGGASDKKKTTMDMLDMFLDVMVPGDDPRLQDSEAKAISEEEIVANTINILIAGYETISTTLQSILYFLALYPEVQQNIVDEVDEVLGESDEITYDHLRNFVYIEQVINESIRIQPVVSMVLRETIEERTYGDLTIPAGSNIIVSLRNVLKDPRHWGEHPDQFDPDRFSPEKCKDRDPLAFIAFGFGPRHCVGQRFAYIELKVVLATLLKEFRFDLSERSEPKKGTDQNIIRVESIFHRPDHPVMVEVVRRN